MSYLLSITVSTRGENSWSRRVHDEFVAQFLAAHPDLSHIERSTLDIPHLTEDVQRAGRMPADQLTPELAQAGALARELTDEILGASAVVIATPMYNWGPPSSLKAWIDHIINARTFYQATGVLAGLPVTAIVASGGLYSEGENVVHDHLRPLLTECFTRIAITDLAFVNCDPSGPMDRGMVSPDDPESGFQRALRAIPAAVTRRRA